MFFMGGITAYAENAYTYVNDLTRAYSVISYASDRNNYGLDICGGNASTADQDAPLLQVYKIGNPVQANQRFEFHFVEMKNGMAVYYITSDLDNNGRLNVKNDAFEEGNNIWFYEHSESSAQKWSVGSNNGGKTAQIFCSECPNLFLSYTSSGECVLTHDNTDPNTIWELNPVAGDYGINTRTFSLPDNTGHAFSDENEVWRYLSPSGAISNIIDVGVSGDHLFKTSYNGVQAFAVSYDS